MTRRLILIIGFLLILFLFGMIEIVYSQVRVGGYIPEAYIVDDDVPIEEPPGLLTDGCI